MLTQEILKSSITDYFKVTGMVIIYVFFQGRDFFSLAFSYRGKCAYRFIITVTSVNPEKTSTKKGSWWLTGLKF